MNEREKCLSKTWRKVKQKQKESQLKEGNNKEKRTLVTDCEKDEKQVISYGKQQKTEAGRSTHMQNLSKQPKRHEEDFAARKAKQENA